MGRTNLILYVKERKNPAGILKSDIAGLTNNLIFFKNNNSKYTQQLAKQLYNRNTALRDTPRPRTT